MATRRLATLLAILLLLGPLGGPTSRAQLAEVASSTLRLAWEPKNGALVALVDAQTGWNFIGPDAATNALWQLEMLPGLVPRVITPAMAREFHWVHSPQNPRELTLVWQDFRNAGPQPLRVEANITLAEKEPLSSWSIRVMMSERMLVQKVRFPRLPEIARQPDERLAVPLWMGQLTTEPRPVIDGCTNPVRRLEWSYPGALSLQCLAFYRQDGPGLYGACDDTKGFLKGFAFFGERPGQIGYEMIHYPAIDTRPPTSYSPAYHTIIGTFRGDWISAAERYRRWGTNQVWAVYSRLNRGLVPDWLLKTSLWVWNRGRSEGVVGPALDLQKVLQLPVGIFWHWWHGCSYDSGFPEYLPPREGTAHLRSALATAHAAGVHAMIYMNQRLWGMTTRSWKQLGAAKYAVEGVDGKAVAEIYNTYTEQPCAAMCLATPFWRRVYASLAMTAVRNLGVDGIYMDQACSSLLCYDPDHGHPLGGGTYWVNSFGTLVTDIRSRTRPIKDILLAGEGVGEAWLPYLDLMLALQVSRERYATPNDGWTCIPFFPAVYHSCGVFYGNYSSLTIPPYDELWPEAFAPKEPLQLLDRKFSTQFYLEQARTFAWGNQPTIANYLLSQREARREEIQYVLKLARVRQRGLKYLLYGTFLRPPAITNAPITFPISHLSIYAGRKGKAEAEKKTKPPSGKDGATPVKNGAAVEIGSLPLIVGAWQAYGGNVGIALANITSETVPFQLDATQYGFGTGDDVRLIGEDVVSELGPLKADGHVAHQLGPRDGVILEIEHRAIRRLAPGGP